jgi:hypothetical protein
MYDNIEVYQNEPGDLDGVAPDVIESEAMQENPDLASADYDGAEK